MDISQEKLEKAKQEAEEFYKSIGQVHCPYFSEKIAFNARGLEHIKFKERNKSRSTIDQYVRLRLLKLAPKVLERSHTLQEFFETKHFEIQKINSRWENRMIKVCYWGFVAILNEARTKVIVKQVEGGNKFFWSIIPFWRNTSKNSQNKKILHAGNLEID